MTGEKHFAFLSFHPVSAFIYLLTVIVIGMFVSNPIVILLLLISGSIFCAMLRGRKFFYDIPFYFALFVIISLINPIFSHNGVTPLFFLNGNPVTLEAVFYGMNISAVMISTLIWCTAFSAVMTSERIMCVFGRILPKSSLVISMSLRFLPLFKSKWHEISCAQKALGYYSEKGFVSKISNSARVFSALISWALENSVDTGDAMKARGYGLAGRTSFSVFRFEARDIVLSVFSAAFLAVSLFGIKYGYFTFRFYPQVARMDFSFWAVCFYAAFAVLVLIPPIFEIKEALHWKYLQSKI